MNINPQDVSDELYAPGTQPELALRDSSRFTKLLTLLSILHSPMSARVTNDKFTLALKIYDLSIQNQLSFPLPTETVEDEEEVQYKAQITPFYQFIVSKLHLFKSETLPLTKSFFNWSNHFPL